MPAELRLPDTREGRHLAGMLARSVGAEVITTADGDVLVRSETTLTVTRGQVETAYGVPRTSPEFERVWARVLSDYTGELVVTETVAVISPTDTPEQGWHIRIPREVHTRWHTIATRLGLTKKAFTALCIERYVREYLPDLHQETLLPETKRALEAVLWEV